eukprot:TRINITY_DN6316_c0_g1_i1.p2 TRINITY_DN6316_c0_g1~~TRINITY_DN6316_c0_g1_i1.p2  ORF type:complete len:270 (-),score=30.01 TRINITY_DN6316_c0_g1_i1:835-1644(-)
MLSGFDIAPASADCDLIENEMEDEHPSMPRDVCTLSAVPRCHPVTMHKHGTTTLAFLYQGGVVVAVDSRSTMGPHIASGTVKKVVEISPYLLGTIAGGAADCQYWERELMRRIKLYELNNKARISVAAASKTLNNIMYYYKNADLSMGIMLAGWDKTGPNLYYLDNEGTRYKGHLFSIGSGSTHAYGVLDSCYRYDLSRDDAIELGRRAIYHATHRDAYTGGIINVYHIGPNGWEKISSEDCFDLHYSKYKGMGKEYEIAADLSVEVKQ